MKTAKNGHGAGKAAQHSDLSSTLPELECDIVMAGGTTSGVVFPAAMVHLSGKYRFRGIGGTSAGAIAAAAVAAAEYGRAKGSSNSFGTITKSFASLGGQLIPLFQPQPGTRRLFGLAVHIIEAKTGTRSGFGAIAKISLAFMRAYWFAVLATVLLYLAVILVCVGLEWLTPFANWTRGEILGALLLAIVLSLAAVASVFYFDMNRLKSLKFGMCPGKTQPGYTRMALMDWLHELIQTAAGMGKDDPPLTFGHLKGDRDDGDPQIDLRMMTTNLSLGIGYALPSLGEGRYFFKPEELSELLPESVLRHMNPQTFATDRGNGLVIKHNGVSLCNLPMGDAMPILLAVRMSLSFPILFTAIPLYKAELVEQGALTDTSDGGVTAWLKAKAAWLSQLANRNRPLPDKDEVYTEGVLISSGPVSTGQNSNRMCTLRRVWFSDGGITSNFPVRFFDSLIPTRPTFGLSLDDREDAGDPGEAVPHAPPVFLPMPKESNRTYEIRSISSLPGFLMAAVNTAREWQDRKQARIPGWQERIARLYLTRGEGGLNLGMATDVVRGLNARGLRAAKLLTGAPENHDEFAFDFQEHQWRRFLLAHRVMTDMLVGFSGKWNQKNLAQQITAAQTQKGLASADYPLSAVNTNSMIADMQALANLAAQFGKNSTANPMKEKRAHIEIAPHDN